MFLHSPHHVQVHPADTQDISQRFIKTILMRRFEEECGKRKGNGREEKGEERGGGRGEEK